MVALGSALVEAKQALRALCPQPLLNWREARYYGRYGEVELHLVDCLCRPGADALDVGANDGSYIHYLRRHVPRIVAFEPMPKLVEALREKFPRGVKVEPVALSDRKGRVELGMPVVDGVAIEGCCTVSDQALATYPDHVGIEVPMDRLDNVYRGDAGFIKIDVEGHEHSVLQGARGTIERCRPRVLVEAEERHAPGSVGRVQAFFRRLGYRGYFVFQRRLAPIESFDPRRMQRSEDIDGYTLGLPRARFERYVNNFLFLPAEEPVATLAHLQAALHTRTPPPEHHWQGAHP